jgi:hypothetical protein
LASSQGLYAQIGRSAIGHQPATFYLLADR